MQYFNFFVSTIRFFKEKVTFLYLEKMPSVPSTFLIQKLKISLTGFKYLRRILEESDDFILGLKLSNFNQVAFNILFS